MSLHRIQVFIRFKTKIIHLLRIKQYNKRIARHFSSCWSVNSSLKSQISHCGRCYHSTSVQEESGPFKVSSLGQGLLRLEKHFSQIGLKLKAYARSPLAFPFRLLPPRIRIDYGTKNGTVPMSLKAAQLITLRLPSLVIEWKHLVALKWVGWLLAKFFFNFAAYAQCYKSVL